ncbi:uncharacterized protein [Arachis hypogaea]|uniref:uncharacterized protein isoform X2 n=1 Tax=Arachis hypogaea TaxID=3818 RepID=UPI000DECA3CA|nr:uncharacterized protein LOC112750541 [Arachis hypogaea]XP_025655096.1 uncharacterized protein LOC112750541 [Arachis hypogaea]QHO12435.1 uncharacterized protein DS421_15g506890 [Arachis hypogaea]
MGERVAPPSRRCCREEKRESPPEKNRRRTVPAAAPNCCWEPCRRSWGCAGKPLPPETPLPSPEGFVGRRCRLKWLPGRRRTGSEIAAVSVQPFFLSLGWCIDACVSCSEFATASFR